MGFYLGCFCLVDSRSHWFTLRAVLVPVSAAAVRFCLLLLRLQPACYLWYVGCSVQLGFGGGRFLFRWKV